MTTFAIFVLVALGLAAVMEEAESVCCYPIQDQYCGDCTKGTPYCSYAKCNIFGCACKDSCRRNCGPWVDVKKISGWLFHAKYDVTCTCMRGKRAAKDAVFDDNDTNGDDKFDVQELDPDLQ